MNIITPFKRLIYQRLQHTGGQLQIHSLQHGEVTGYLVYSHTLSILKVVSPHQIYSIFIRFSLLIQQSYPNPTQSHSSPISHLEIPLVTLRVNSQFTTLLITHPIIIFPHFHSIHSSNHPSFPNFPYFIRHNPLIIHTPAISHSNSISIISHITSQFSSLYASWSHLIFILNFNPISYHTRHSFPSKSHQYSIRVYILISSFQHQIVILITSYSLISHA